MRSSAVRPGRAADLDAELAALITGLQAAGDAAPAPLPQTRIRPGGSCSCEPRRPMAGVERRGNYVPARPHCEWLCRSFAAPRWAPPLPRRRGGRLLDQLATAASAAADR